MIRSYDHCEFVSERKVFDALAAQFGGSQKVILYPNYQLFDAGKKVYLECDLLVVSRHYIGIVELKDWFGSVVVKPHGWVRGQRRVDDPHIVNQSKCKILKGNVEKLLPGVHGHHLPYVQSTVVLTHEDCDIRGADNPKAAINNWPTLSNITLEGVNSLIEYLRAVEKKNADEDKAIPQGAFNNLVAILDRQSEQHRTDYSDQISGYHILEDKEHTPQYVTYIAKEVLEVANGLSRLRVFGVESTDPAVREKQVRSLSAVANLPAHPNIQQIRNHPNGKKLIVEVSDWTDARTLEERLSDDEGLDWELAAKVALGVARGLHHIHSAPHPVVHRNVSPKSVVLDNENQPKLTDFNLAFDPGAMFTVMGDESETAFSSYTSPEVLAHQPDFKSDVFSLGVIWYEMLVGRPPFKNALVRQRQTEALTDKQLQDLTVNLSGAPSEHLALFLDLIARMVDPDIGQRPDAGEVVARLEGVLTRSDGATRNKLPGMATYGDRKLIGKGQTGEVYYADNHGERLALKVFNDSVPRDKVLAERDLLKLIDSPYVPRCHPLQQWEDGRWCLPMDFAEGKSLRALIEAGQRPAAKDFQTAVEQSLEALAGMHSEDVSVIHNDLNPANILYDSDVSLVKVIDFGCASRPDVVTIRGTPGYIDPELVDRTEMLSCPVGDLYGLAVTLCEWASGTRAITGDSDWAFELEGFDQAQREALTQWARQAVGPSANRYSSAAEMLAAFRKAIAPAPDVGLPVTQGTAVVGPQLNEPDQTAYHATEAVKGGACGASGFVAYLNSLHNLHATNANALAESQATNRFFGQIYVEPPLVGDLYRRMLEPGKEAVFILTGHAGDGKSTIALDVLKRLRNIPASERMPAPPAEIEEIQTPSGPITILKDMSELSAEARLDNITNSLSVGSGTWLVVSNTGPLLNTLREFVKQSTQDLDGFESDLLQVLDEPVTEAIDEQRHAIKAVPGLFSKPIYIVNLTKIQNVDLAAQVLAKFTQHPVWGDCGNCQANGRCPIAANVSGLKAMGGEAPRRVTLIYSRLANYEKRMTMRQMVAHLAYSLTSGLECGDVVNRLAAGTYERVKDWFGPALFSENFFGIENGKKSIKAAALYCVRRLQELHFGSQSSPGFERRIQEGILSDIAVPVAPVDALLDVWMDGAVYPNAVDWRARIRRSLYFFAQPAGNAAGAEWGHFLDTFLQSPLLLKWDEMLRGQMIPSEMAREFKNRILGVLNEMYSGYSKPRYSNNSTVYVTLRRGDHAMQQSVQLVIAAFSFQDFRIEFERNKQMPVLRYHHGSACATLELSLPLLDYVAARSCGDFSQSLDPIYLNELDRFCSDLLLTRDSDASDTIQLISMGLDGDMEVTWAELDANSAVIRMSQ